VLVAYHAHTHIMLNVSLTVHHELTIY